MDLKYFKKNVVGCDETGVGDYFTPLVGTCVFVNWKNVEKLVNLGITDSKKLSDTEIVKLASQSRKLVVARTSYMSQKQYNFLTSKYKFNAHVLKTIIHLWNINYIEENVNDIDLVIIDKYSSDKNFAKYINTLIESDFKFNYKEGKKIKSNFKLYEKGELEHIAVATASVLARAKLIELMKNQNQKWNTKFPLGATTKIVVPFGRKFIEKHDLKNLYEVAKISFKTTDAIKNNN